MAKIDLYNRISVAASLQFAARTATTNGATVDLKGYQSAVFVVHTGVMTDGTHTIDLQESDDDSTWTSVAAADIIGTEPALVLTDDNVIETAGYGGSKRYVRAISTVSGTTTGGVYGAYVIRGNSSARPTQ